MARRATNAPEKPYKPLVTNSDRLAGVYERYKASGVAAHLAYGNRFVPGTGQTEQPQIMFIGDAPTLTESRYGRSGVGYHRVLHELLTPTDIGLHDVFITHLMKYRPKRPRALRPGEILTCRPYLNDEIMILKPRVIVCWSTVVARYWEPTTTMARDHGRTIALHPDSGSTIVAMFHPGNILLNPGARKTLARDMNIIKEIIQT